MTLLSYFTEVKDPRRAQGQRFSFEQLLQLIIISNLCGYFGGRAIAKFVKYNSKVFTEYLGLKYRPPSHVTFSDIINRLCHKEMIKAFNKWASTPVIL